MSQFVIANDVNTQLAAPITSTATSLTLASAANLPTLSAGQVMPLVMNDEATQSFYEVMYVTAISGATLTVQRGQEGTTALNWNVGDYAYCAPTSGTVAMVGGNPNQTFMVATAVASNQAVPLAQITQTGVTPGRLLNIKTFTASGTYTPTTGTQKIVVEAVGGGGASGGAPATASGVNSAGGSGGGGAYIQALVSAVPSSVAVTVGNGGIGASGIAGGNGGTTSFGSYVSVQGGTGGSVLSTSAFPATIPSGNGGTSLITSGCTVIKNSFGASGTLGQIDALNGSALSGAGGNSVLGTGGGPVGFSGTPSLPAANCGAGAGGTLNNGSSAAATGANGSAGLVVVFEYA